MPVDAEVTSDPAGLQSDAIGFRNYSGIDDNPEAVKVIDSYVRKGWLREFATEAELRKFLGGAPIYNQFACLTKVRADGTV